MEILKDTQEFSKEDVAFITKMFYEDGCGKTHFFRCGMKAALTKICF